ncbi:MAG: ABC transporter ATP-binding protein [Thermoflexales bacterium]|nr:ABC transporter ATP-binding protein [Thermoflexales bacterium]
MSPVISVENVSKYYRLGAIGTQTLQEDWQRWWARVRGRPDPLLKVGQQDHGNRQGEYIWALRDVSFQVAQGDILGIIGRNGAGKSTLLKILSRVTAPSSGQVKLKGRIASLLEVGTGFHPELTGRENIYMNGAILGMRHAEIDRKFDEIVAFSEVEQFIDTPVKRYSSGMYVRLAFAVAAHLDPEILLVDEVLAVGDAAFQKRCLGKMEDVAQGGRTILFVSHNMAAISTLCHRVIWIDKGSVVQDSPGSQVISNYLHQGALAAGQKVWTENDRPGNQSFRLNSVTLKSVAGVITPEINISEEMAVEIEYAVTRPGARAAFSLVLWSANGSCVFGSLSNTSENIYHGQPLQSGCYRSTCYLHGNLLNSGRYYISIIGMSDHWQDNFNADQVLLFEALDDGVLKRDYPGSYGGVVRPKLVWKTIAVAD